MNHNVLAAARQLGRRPASSTYGLVHSVLQDHPGAVQQSIAQGLRQTQQIKSHVRSKVANRHGLNHSTPYTQHLQHSLSSSDSSRLCMVLERMLLEHVRVGRPTYVSQGQLDELAGRVLLRVLEGAEEEWWVAAERVVEIGWRVGRRTRGVVWPALGMAVAERGADWREYGRWRTLLRWPVGDTELARRLLDSARIGPRMLDDMFDCAVEAGMDAGMAAAFYCAALKVHDEMPDKVAKEISAQHGSIIGSLELPGAGRALAALAHVHVARGDCTRLEECLACFAPATASSGWPLGALAQAIRTMQAQGSTDKCLRVLAAVACNDHAEFVRVVGSLPVFRQRAVRNAMLADELDIRRVHKRVPLTRYFVPRVFLHLNDSLVHQMVYRYFSQGDEDERGFARHARVAGMLAYRLRSPRPVLWLLQNARGFDDCRQASERLDALARVVGEFWMARHVREYAEGRRTREAYGRVMGRCTGYREGLLRMHLRLGVEPSVGALGALYEGSARCNWRLAAALVRRIPYRAVPDYLAIYLTLLARLAPNHPSVHLQLYRHLITHPFMSPSARESLTTHVLREHVGRGHFYGRGYFRLERTLVNVGSLLPVAFGKALWPRIWALHMFLRRRRLVPRYTLYPWLLERCRDGTCRLQVTPIPSREEQRAMGAKGDLAVLEEWHVRAAVQIVSSNHCQQHVTTKDPLESMLANLTTMVE